MYLDFTSFYLLFFSAPWSLPGHWIMFRHYVSLASSCLWQFLRFSLFSMNLTVLRSTGEVFCRGSHNWGFSDVSLIVILRFCVLGRRTIEVMVIPIRIDQGYYMLSTWLITMTITLTNWLRQSLSGFSTVNLRFSPPHLPLQFPLKGSN